MSTKFERFVTMSFSLGLLYLGYQRDILTLWPLLSVTVNGILSLSPTLTWIWNAVDKLPNIQSRRRSFVNQFLLSFRFFTGRQTDRRLAGGSTSIRLIRQTNSSIWVVWWLVRHFNRIHECVWWTADRQTDRQTDKHADRLAWTERASYNDAV